MIILEPKNWFLEFSNLHSGKVEKNNDLKYSNYLPLCKKLEKTNDPFLRKMPHWRIDKQTDRQADGQAETDRKTDRKRTSKKNILNMYHTYFVLVLLDS